MTDIFRPLYYRPVTHWVSWFAWRPVDTDDHGWVWLRTIQRRRVQRCVDIPNRPARGWQYVTDPTGGIT